MIQNMRMTAPNNIDTNKTIIISGHDISKGLTHFDGIGCKLPRNVQGNPCRYLTALCLKVRIQPSKAQIPKEPPANIASPFSDRCVTAKAPKKKKIITRICSQTVFMIQSITGS